MSISKTLIVNINKDKAKAKDKMFIYKNDVGVDLYIELANLGYSFDNVENDFKFANALFKTPNGTLNQLETLTIVNKRIKFSFTQSVVNLMQEIGSYELQFQLFDLDGNRLTIPSYFFEVKEPLGNSAITHDLGIVGYAITDLSYVGGEEEALFAIEDGYIKTTWVTGDIITSAKLNNLENGVSLAVESAGGVYQSSVPSTVEVGGIPKGFTATDGVSVNDLLYQMLHPSQAPTVTLSISPNVTLYELGTSVPSISLTATAVKGSNTIQTVAITRDGSVLSKGSTTLTTTATKVRSATVFGAYISDGTSTVYSEEIRVNFVNPIYVGVLDNITATAIQGLTKRVVEVGTQSYTFNMDSKRMCIAVPSGWALSSIVDQNGFVITNSFTVTSVNISCLDGVTRAYQVYYSDITSQNNFTVEFNF